MSHDLDRNIARPSPALPASTTKTGTDNDMPLDGQDAVGRRRGLPHTAFCLGLNVSCQPNNDRSHKTTAAAAAAAATTTTTQAANRTAQAVHRTKLPLVHLA